MRVQSFQDVRAKEVALMIEMIAKDGGSVTDLSELIFWLINNIVCKVAVGKTYRGLKFRNLLERFVEVLGAISVGSYIPWLSWIDRVSGLEEKAHGVAKELDEFFESVVEEHRNKREGMENAQSDEEQDLVDILLDVQRDDTNGFTFDNDTIKALILDVFIAGTDTTFATLIWSISELIRHPRVMKKLQQEVTDIAQGKPLILEKDLEKMEYLKLPSKRP
ncbi:hypothetical protein OSB04_004643 [Centaurea solstitialis]|uniref:Cytochrome P450 n=1 Tax=Centaurea solstitialis TaxID=347529 RepID=A0AA38TEG6_9ASTR|nr:hypothetical protein OSB04_004643 [Centaurea solstitialis]